MKTREPGRRTHHALRLPTHRSAHRIRQSTTRSRTTGRTDLGYAAGSKGKGHRMNTEPIGELITVQAAADRLAVSRWMVYQLIWHQRVKSVQIGRCRRIVRQSLDDYLSGLIEGAA